MFQSIDITNKALDASLLRLSILNNNITNVETPGFKRQDVSFEAQLSKELDKYGPKGIDIQTVEPKIYTDGVNRTMRMDGNNVDIDREMAELAKTKLRYETLVQRATAQIGRYKYILQNVK